MHALVMVLWPTGSSVNTASCEAGRESQDFSSLLQSKATALLENSITALPEESKQCNLKRPPPSSDSPKSFEHFRNEYDQGLYVNLDARFAFCLIEKNACSAWLA